MKVISALRAITITFSILTAAHSANAQSAASGSFGRCIIPSGNLIQKLVVNAVKQDLIAKGHTQPVASVIILGKTVRTAVTLANVTGLTSVTMNTAGTGYTLNTSGTLSMPCTISAKVSVRGSYIDKTTKARKLFSSATPQEINFAGAFS